MQISICDIFIFTAIIGKIINSFVAGVKDVNHIPEDRHPASVDGIAAAGIQQDFACGRLLSPYGPICEKL